MDNGHLSIEEIEQLIQQKGPAEYQTHVEICQQCRSLLQKSRAFSAKLVKLASVRIGAGNAMKCPDEKVWCEVAGGTLSDSESLRHVQHAAECSACGKKLKAATRMFEEELSSEEKQVVETLPSAGAEQRRKLAERLASTGQTKVESVTEKRKLSLWRPFSYALATSVTLILVAFFSLSFWTDTLLARGYRERGTLELRIAKADPPKEGTRGAIDEKERPVSLVLADLMIRARLAIRPKSPYWLGEKGRLELIEGKPATALVDLQEAHRLDSSSKTITIDLASTYTQTGGKENLFRAEDLLLSILPAEKDDVDRLRADSDNLLSVYNLAVLYELTGAFDQAIRELELYLKLDGTSQWADSARKRIESIKNQRHGKAPPAPTAPIAEWLLYLDSGESNASEAALDVALSEWLPRRFERSAHLEGVLSLLAKKLEDEHQDSWLAQVLASRPSHELDYGFNALQHAIQQNAVADFESAIVSAQQAETLFRRTGSLAGLVRAQLEEVYSYQRSTKGELCLQTTREVQKDILSKDFPWIAVQLQLDKSSCLNLLDRPQEAKMEADDAEEIVSRSKYRILGLRASGIRAGVGTTRGNHTLALNIDITGLRQYWSDWYPLERSYQFYSDITFNAEAEHLWHVASDTGEEAALVISATSHKELETLTRYRRAKALVMLNQPEAAQRQIDSADGLFFDLPQNPALTRYRTDGILSVTRAKSDMGDDNEAISMLEHLIDLETSESMLVLKRLYQLKGDMAMKRDALSDAATAYIHALALAESAMTRLTSVRDRLLWNRDNILFYKLLIQILLEDGDSAVAFDLWESYKGALVRKIPLLSYESGTPVSLTTLSTNLQKLVDFRRSIDKIRPGEAIISYIFLRDGLTAWLLDHNGLEVKKLMESSDALHDRFRQFIAECSDPTSDVDQLRLHGQQLYQILLTPFASRLVNITTLIVEGDDELETLPLEALVTDSGDYLIDKLTIVHSPGLLVRRHLRLPNPLTLSTEVLAVGSPALSERWNSILGPLPSAIKEAAMVHSIFPRSNILIGSGATLSAVQDKLPTAVIFHFAGHSIQTNSGAALLLSQHESSSIEDTALTGAGLAGNRMKQLQLVILSACATGSGSLMNDDRFIEPFLLAGVPQIIASRWQIDSAITLRFMTTFYQLLIHGRSAAIALADTMLALRRVDIHPYYWASFLFFGRA